MSREQITKVCEHCQNPFPRPRMMMHTRWAARRFCSRTCAQRGRAGTMAEQFWASAVRGTHPDECWGWLGQIDRTYGYAKFRFNGVVCTAARASWQLHYGSIPDDLYVCHDCDNIICSNPSHLFLGTQLDNMQDASRKGRMQRGEARHNAKLTADDVRFIRASSESNRSLADRFQTTAVYIAEIRRCQSVWKHLR